MILVEQLKLMNKFVKCKIIRCLTWKFRSLRRLTTLKSTPENIVKSNYLAVAIVVATCVIQAATFD